MTTHIPISGFQPAPWRSTSVDSAEHSSGSSGDPGHLEGVACNGRACGNVNTAILANQGFSELEEEGIEAERIQMANEGTSERRSNRKYVAATPRAKRLRQHADHVTGCNRMMHQKKPHSLACIFDPLPAQGNHVYLCMKIPPNSVKPDLRKQTQGKHNDQHTIL